MTAAGTWFEHAGLGVVVHWPHTSVAGLELSWLVGGLSAPPHCQAVPVDQCYATAESFESLVDPLASVMTVDVKSS